MGASKNNPTEMCSTDGRHLMLDGSTGQYVDVGACEDQPNHVGPATPEDAADAAEDNSPMAQLQKGATGFNTQDPIVNAGLSLYKRVTGAK